MPNLSLLHKWLVSIAASMAAAGTIYTTGGGILAGYCEDKRIEAELKVMIDERRNDFLNTDFGDPSGNRSTP